MSRPPLPVPPQGRNAEFYLEVVNCLRALQTPQGPTPLWSCRRVRLPPADKHTNCVVFVEDLGVVALSNGKSWLRQDTGAAL